jgi:S1-C subfamily serine protease
MTHLARPAPAILALTLALAAPAARADIPPIPRVVAGLDFENVYDPTSSVHARIVELTDCDADSADCRAAKAAGVIGAKVVKVNGLPVDDLESVRAVFQNLTPPQTVAVTFQRTQGGAPKGAYITVRFAGQ